MKKIYGASVIIFWLCMMGLLFQKEVLPTFIITNPAGYKIQVTKDNPVRESWMGIYFKDKRIGFSNTVMSQAVENGVAGYRINETTLLRLNMLGEQRFIRIKGNSFFSESYILKNFRYRLISSGHKVDVRGYLADGNLSIVVDIGGNKQAKSFKVKQNTLISNSISPILLFKKPDINREISFEIFDPITFGTNKVSIKSIGREIVESGGVEYNAYIFETDISGIKTKTWMREDGDVLKEESLLGFTMRKESPENALNIIAHSSQFTSGDLMSEFSLRSNIEISNPRDVSYLKLEKNGAFVEIFKNKEPLSEHILPIPIEEIPEVDFIQSKDERILTLASEIIGEEKNSWVACKRILAWVYTNLEKTPTLSVPSSLDVLRSMKGDCNEHTVLFTALSRSVGIPTKMIAGLVYSDGVFYYHAWPEVYIGKWVGMDPTLGQEIADATHIPLLEGGLKEQLELVKIIGDLKIRVIEYK